MQSSVITIWRKIYSLRRGFMEHASGWLLGCVDWLWPTHWLTDWLIDWLASLTAMSSHVRLNKRLILSTFLFTAGLWLCYTTVASVGRHGDAMMDAQEDESNGSSLSAPPSSRTEVTAAESVVDPLAQRSLRALVAERNALSAQKISALTALKVRENRDETMKKENRWWLCYNNWIINNKKERSWDETAFGVKQWRAIWAIIPTTQYFMTPTARHCFTPNAVSSRLPSLLLSLINFFYFPSDHFLFLLSVCGL